MKKMVVESGRKTAVKATAAGDGRKTDFIRTGFENGECRGGMKNPGGQSGRAAKCDRERRSAARTRRLRMERRRKCFALGCTLLAACCMILICAMAYGSIRSEANSGFKYYTVVTVETGDTLWEIADSYVDYDYYKNKDSYISEVRSINHLDEACSVSAGQTLILPYYSPEFVY